MKFTTKKLIIIFLVVVITSFFVFFPKTPLTNNCTTTSDCFIQRAIEIPILIIGGAFVLKDVLINQILPATDVQIVLDDGTVRPAKLSYKSIGSRPVENGDKVRLNCSQNTMFQNKKLCELEFFGFDKYSSCAKNSPCYGKIPSMSILVDQFGLPDESMLKYSK